MPLPRSGPVCDFQRRRSENDLGETNALGTDSLSLAPEQQLDGRDGEARCSRASLSFAVGIILKIKIKKSSV